MKRILSYFSENLESKDFFYDLLTGIFSEAFRFFAGLPISGLPFRTTSKSALLYGRRSDQSGIGAQRSGNDLVCSVRFDHDTVNGSNLGKKQVFYDLSYSARNFIRSRIQLNKLG